jgi:hypothetical protein
MPWWQFIVFPILVALLGAVIGFLNWLLGMWLEGDRPGDQWDIIPGTALIMFIIGLIADLAMI